MPTHETRSSGSQPSTAAPKTDAFAPRPFEVAFPGQEAASPTNPFPRRPHEVWMGESAGSAGRTQGQEQPASGAGFDWNRISLYAEGQTPPEPPRWPGVQAKLTIGRPDHPYDQEADRMANQGRTPPVPLVDAEPTQPVQRQPITPLAQQPNFSRVDWFSHAPQRRPVTNPLQAKLTISQPNDVYEQEADCVAEQVMSMAPPATPNIQRQAETEESEEIQPKLVETITPIVQRQEASEDEELLQAKCEACEQQEPEEPIQRSADGTAQAQPDFEQRLNTSKGSGSPLPQTVRNFMEPRFGTDFSQVRVHTGSDAVQMNKAVRAQAFTHGSDVYFGAGKAPGINDLTAHELTHVVQQAGGLQLKNKGTLPKATRSTAAQPLRTKAISQIAPFDRSLQRQSAFPEATPEDSLQAKVLPDAAIATLNRATQPDLGTDEAEEIQAKALPDREVTFLSETSTLAGKTIQRKSLAISSSTPQIQRGLWDTVRSGAQSVAQGVSGVVSGGLDAIRQRLLQPVAQLASRMPGYPLLTLILGRDPVTGTAVERNATNLVQGILSFVPGGNQMFQNLQESRALENAFNWLSEQVTRLNLTWDAIRSLFQRVWESLSAGDLLNPGAAFDRIRNIFAEPIQRIRNFAAAVGQKVLEFVFEGAMRLAGGASEQVMGLIRRAGGVFTSIIRDPIAFVGNLVQAVRGGFQRFAGNILAHLRNGLMGWLFGALAGAGLQMPQSFDLRGIVSIVLQILGATYQRLRGLLARRIGEQRVARLEQVFSFLQTLATEGLAGAWRQIMEFAGNLQEMVIGGIREWVMTSIVQAAVTRLVSMFNPAGAIVQAAIAIYNTVMFFIERAQQIASLANAVFESIGNIASGNVGGAIAYVEQAMGRALPVVISFMARLLGLGNVSGQIRNIIGRVQGVIERAIERLVGWITTRASGLLGRGRDRGTGTTAGAQQAIQTDNRSMQQKQADLESGLSDADRLVQNEELSIEEIRQRLPEIKTRYRMLSLELVVRNEGEERQSLHVEGQVNPPGSKPPHYRNLRELIQAQSPVNAKYRGQIVKFANPPLKDRYPEGLRFDVLGFPDFRPYAIAIVRINMRGNRGYGPEGDMAEANEKAGFPRSMRHPNHTWHHHQDRTTMLLIPFDLHDAVKHSGGVWVIKNLGPRR